MDELHGRKLAHNEALFRAVNETIAAARSPREPTRFICECADPNCALTIELSRGEYEHVRGHDRWFFVLPDHEQPEIETIIERRNDYYIVEKTVPVPES